MASRLSAAVAMTSHDARLGLAAAFPSERKLQPQLAATWRRRTTVAIQQSRSPELDRLRSSLHLQKLRLTRVLQPLRQSTEFFPRPSPCGNARPQDGKGSSPDNRTAVVDCQPFGYPIDTYAAKRIFTPRASVNWVGMVFSRRIKTNVSYRSVILESPPASNGRSTTVVADPGS